MRRRVLLLTLLIGAPFGAAQNSADQWELADRQIKRLPPAAFPQLPPAIVQALESRGCTIPQTYIEPKPHNVIRGEFAKPGQTDWAVLCSINRASSILIFWAGAADDIAAIAQEPDRSRLQGIGGDQIGYSRHVSPAGRQYIEEHYEIYRSSGAPEPPPIDHEGINDAFMEKASTVRYLYNGKWLELQGAD